MDPNQLKIFISRHPPNEDAEIGIEEFDSFLFKTGDTLQVVPEDMISQIHKTPDGSMHLSINDSGAIRIPDKMSLFEFKGFKIPEHLILLTGAGSETLDTIGQAHITNYKKFMGLEPDMTLLEIGCGIGRDAF